MYKNLLWILRMTIGLILLMIGIIGLFLPILQGWLLIFIAIPIISPRHGKMVADKLKTFFNKNRENSDKNPHNFN